MFRSGVNNKQERQTIPSRESKRAQVRGIGGQYEVGTITQVWREMDLVVARLQFLHVQGVSENGRGPRQQGLGEFLEMTISHLVRVIKTGRQLTVNREEAVGMRNMTGLGRVR